MIKTAGELIEYRARAHPDRVALYFEGESLTYSQMNLAADQAARYLRGRGLAKGDRIGALGFNTPELLHLFHGAVKIGAVPVMVNWRLTAGEARYILLDAEAKIFFYDDEFAGIAGDIKLEIPFLTMNEFRREREAAVPAVAGSADVGSAADGPVADVPGAAGSGVAGSAAVGASDVFTQLYTSGTTGYPKGALLSHANILAMIAGVARETPGFGADSVNLIAGPFFNIAGVGIHMLGLHVGARNVLVRRFDPVVVAKLIAELRVTNLFLAPAMMQAILGAPDAAQCDFSSLRNIQYGGSTISRDLLKQAAETFGCRFTQAYGLTETAGIASLLRWDEHEKCLAKDAPDDIRKRLASAGRSAPGMEIVVKNDAGMLAPAGEPGEVCIKGDYLFSGYWKRADVQPFDAEGWFRTGDVGFLDEEGLLFLMDRKNDMIVTGGMNVYPAEIERVYAEHPDIKDIAIIGIPDDEFGETIHAAIIPAPGASIELEELRAWGRDRLAGYKLPRKMGLVAELPRNPSGKVLRRELREPFWKGRERRV